MVKRIRSVLLAFIAITAMCAFVSAENLELKKYSRIDWDEGVLKIDIEANISQSVSPGKARVAAEELLRQEIGSAFCDALYKLNLDSYRSVKDAVQDDSLLLAALLDLGSRAVPFNIYLNTTLDTLTAQYVFDFFPDIFKVFTRHTQPYAPLDILEFVPAVEYTGIVIYAKGKYPVHGEDPAQKNPETFNPSLLPKLYDTEMETVAEARMMDPEYLTGWGVFGYTNTTDYLRYKERIGAAPLFTIARGVFGDNRTDLLIPIDAAKKILATPANRELIRQGRILVICDIPNLD
jgi:hypothetical protein